MANMQLNKTRMPEQEPFVRNKNWKEVALGYSEQDAISEAKRCLNCKNMPCVSGCPVGVKIPEFIKKVAEGDFEGAYHKIKETNSLPAVCGRVCPQENQCEHNCVRAVKGESVGIGRLERFVADYHREHASDSDGDAVKISEDAAKVAIIGSGPAGLSCAGDLVKMGYKVTVFEALHKAGGVLSYGIPEFRLPKDIVDKEVRSLEKMGVEIRLDTII